MRRAGLLVILLGLGPAIACGAPPAAPSPFARLVEALDRSEPLSRAAVERLVGPLHCQGQDRIDCDAKGVRIGDVKIGGIDFRRTDRGSILVLDGLAGHCVPVADLRARYGLDRFTQSCTDGAVCNYFAGPRPWGKMSVGLGAQPATASCATSLVLDSFPG